jgi:hypothetical protein
VKNVVFRDVTPCKPVTSTETSEERTTSIFHVEDQAKE